MLVRNVFRVGVLAAALVSSGISGAGTGFAGTGSASAPQPPTITLMPAGVIHVDAPADGSAWTCKGMSLLPLVNLSANVAKQQASTGSAMLDSVPWQASVDLHFPANSTVLWECDSAGSGKTTYKSEAVLQTLP
ncbi:hypothetical protein [Nocardia yamanashiensis]|uniref:hypothetical protein n=1 Tax=Nocardia yamanashiensis TaxID=209247 RepID=UPI000A6374EF|nr:hypothetical protein [Nocardia yamanashiensis]